MNKPEAGYTLVQDGERSLYEWEYYLLTGKWPDLQNAHPFADIENWFRKNCPEALEMEWVDPASDSVWSAEFEPYWKEYAAFVDGANLTASLFAEVTNA